MILDKSAWELANGLRRKEFSSLEITDSYLKEIERKDPDLGCYLALNAEEARESARKIDQAGIAEDAHPLNGIPIAIKDNISTFGLETTCASKILKGYIPPFDATVITKLKEIGCPILGKTNMDEFAMGASTETSAFKQTKNPWDTERSPGGSSGGSAAAVASKLSPLALGSDTGGSIRQPAALCGVVGFKPTYGRASRYGLVAFGSSLDQIGPFARNVQDAALLASAISGHDHRDSSSLPIPSIKIPDFNKSSLKGKRIAVPNELIGEGIEAGVRKAFDEALEQIKKEGAIVEHVSLPSIEYGVSTYYIIAPAEASSNLARFDGIRYGMRSEGKGHIELVEKTRGQGFGHEVKTRIMIGTYVLSAGYYDAYYVRAQTVRQLMTHEFLETFKSFDAIISPTSPVVAFKLGELLGDPLALKLLDFCTIPANMGGFPGISINCGFSAGLPVGLQLLAAPEQDEFIFDLAYAIERALPASGKLP